MPDDGRMARVRSSSMRSGPRCSNRRVPAWRSTGTRLRWISSMRPRRSNCWTGVGAHDVDGFIARGRLRQGEGALGALRNERERGLALDQCRGGAVREHEAGQVKRAILAPRLFAHIERAPAHHDRAGRPRRKHLRGRLDVRRIRGGEHPLVQPLAADAHRLFDADIRSGDETVQRRAHMYPHRSHDAHRNSAGRCRQVAGDVPTAALKRGSRVAVWSRSVLVTGWRIRDMRLSLRR